MKYYRLRKEDAGIFAGLDPYGWLALLSLPNGFAIAAMESERSREGAGILIGSATKDVMTIHWLAVSASTEGRGVGGLLLQYAFDRAVAAGIPELRAVIAPAYEKDRPTAGRASYFAERFFTEEVPLAGQWQGTVGSLLLQGGFSKDDAHLPQAVELSSMATYRLTELVEMLSEEEGALSLYPIKGEQKKIDETVSFVIMDLDDPCGGLLIQQMEESLLPVYFYAESEREADALVNAAATAAEKRYGLDMPVDIILPHPEEGGADSAEITARAIRELPGDAAGGKLLIAKTKDYVAYAEGMERSNAHAE